MAIDLSIGQYHHANSLIHKLDARVKITLSLALFATAFLVNGMLGLTVILGLELIALLSTTIKPKYILKAILPLLFFLVFPLVFNLFFNTTGDVLFSWGILLVTTDGLHKAVFFTLRLLAMFLIAVILTLTTAPIALTDAIGAMLRPFARFGLPAYEISMMISIAMRFIPTLLGDLDAIRKAQLARGAGLAKGGPAKQLRAITSLLVPLFAKSLRHSEELALAMESRCYHGGTDRSHYHTFSIEAIDIAACCFCTILLVATIVWL